VPQILVMISNRPFGLNFLGSLLRYRSADWLDLKRFEHVACLVRAYTDVAAGKQHLRYRALGDAKNGRRGALGAIIKKLFESEFHHERILALFIL